MVLISWMFPGSIWLKSESTSWIDLYWVTPLAVPLSCAES